MFMFFYKREIVRLYKSYLVILEDIRSENNNALFKLSNQLPIEHIKTVELLNPLDDFRVDFYRKKILDNGNDCIRALDEELKKYKIDFRSPNQ